MEAYAKVEKESVSETAEIKRAVRFTYTVAFIFIGCFFQLFGVTLSRAYLSGNFVDTAPDGCFTDFTDCLNHYRNRTSDYDKIPAVLTLCLECKDLRGEENVTVSAMTCSGNQYCDNIP